MRLLRHYANDQGLRIGYVQLGAGPPVLLLHGLGGTADFWQPLIERLASRYTVIAPDLLGFGFSDKPASLRYTPERHQQAVSAVLGACGVSTLNAVVSHSCGGVIAMSLLASGAISTTRLALAAAAYPSPRFPVRAELLRSPRDRAMLAWRPLAQLTHHALMLVWPFISRFTVPSELRGAWAGYLDHSVATYASTAEECLFRANLDPLLPALHSIPILLLYGRNDRTVPFVHGTRLAAALPHSVLQLIDGGHYSVLGAGLPKLLAWLVAEQQP